MPQSLVILGSARSDGHTAALLKRLTDGVECEVIDLNTTRIAHFRYDQQYPTDDEFLDIIERMLAAPIVVFASPVYWYSFSTVMKNFLDRLSDLLMSRKDLGRRLRGTRWALVSSGSDPQPDPDLTSAFQRTCAYLGVACIATLYAVEGGNFIDEHAAAQLRAHLQSSGVQH